MEGGAENDNDKLKGKGAERAREQQRQEEIRKDQMYSGDLKGKGLRNEQTREEAAESAEEFELTVGDVIEVRNLKVTTVAGYDVYTGKLTVIGIREQGSVSMLKGAGPVPPLPERSYNFRVGEGVTTATAPESAVKQSIEKKY